jgi:hypothetical protein
MNSKQQIIRTVIIWLLLLVFMTVFDPNKLPVLLLIVPFILLFAALYSTWNTIAAIRGEYARGSGAQPRPRKRLGCILSASAVLLLILESLGQLTIRDVVTIGAILILGYIYVLRSRFGTPKQ